MWFKKKRKELGVFYRKFPKIKQIHLSMGSLEKKLDTLFSKFVRLSGLNSQGYIICVTCGGFFTYRMIDCGHYIGREERATRWEERNTGSQCHSCNRYAEGKKAQFALYLQRKYGLGILQELNDQVNKFSHFTASELEEKIKYYQEKVKQFPHS